MCMEEKMTTREYLFNRMEKGAAGISAAILVSLGIGLLLKSIGGLTGLDLLLTIGTVATLLMAPALGAAIAHSLGANSLTVVSAMIAAAVGASAVAPAGEAFTLKTGEPVGAIIAAIIATYAGKKVTGRTFLDLMAVPLAAVLSGGIAGYYLSTVIAPALVVISKAITSSVDGHPLLASVVIVVFAVLVMTPASSAALAVALQLDPHASAAALVGITAQFVGFTAISLRENDLGGFLAQLICTPKVQFPNIVRNPNILIAPLVGAAVAGPVAVLVFKLGVPSAIAGLGLSGLIAPIQILTEQGSGVLLSYMIAGVVIPLLVAVAVHYLLLRRANLVKTGDLALQVS
ncbi:PTS sugar transporter subunit IIC [Macrococcus equipercicus]|uniref:PTS sugar transporter subunit IIC n=2 Tax=Macrococcus equipercicus TaxID=69967 RepID=A0A9Q9BV37_9STAP|nr:PTS sugar transporter subunit IIC [Macrococcus equipercicus]UTH13667.1 PTS sugar transporter subunit IIC [Macrococcus equipercicus]